jgi:hypothetical protein
MGIIDEKTYSLACVCGAAESSTLHQHGSSHAGGDWQTGKPFERFEVAWSADAWGTPQIVSATCKQCDATVIAGGRP